MNLLRKTSSHINDNNLILIANVIVHGKSRINASSVGVNSAVKEKLRREWLPEYKPEEIRPPQETPDTISERATNVTLSMIFQNAPLFRKTKIVCTMGPKCWSEQVLGKLIDAGLDIMRMNFSHGSHEGHLDVLKRFRKVRRYFCI